MREFNENILESLDDGLVVFDADERIVRWNRALEEFYGVDARRRRSAGRSARCSTRRSSRRCAPRGASIPYGATLFRVPLAVARRATTPRLLVNATEVPLQNSAGDDDALVGTHRC